MIFPSRRILCSDFTVGVMYNLSNLLMICKLDSLKKKGVLNNSFSSTVAQGDLLMLAHLSSAMLGL